MAEFSERRGFLGELAREIAARRYGHPLRVAVDGRTASGKTTFADDLAASLSVLGRIAIRTSIDGFHRPREARYARGRFSPEGYYEDARDLEAVRRLLLDPLGPGGDRIYRTAAFDLARDVPVEVTPQVASADDVVIVDGTFLLRPELRDGWDLAIYLDVREEVARERGIARDAAAFGGEPAALEMFERRYLPAFRGYLRSSRPRERADFVIDLEDFDAPRLVKRP